MQTQLQVLDLTVGTLGFRLGSDSLYSKSLSDRAISAGCFCRPLPPNKKAMLNDAAPRDGWLLVKDTGLNLHMD